MNAITEFIAQEVLDNTDCATGADTFADLVLVRRDHLQSSTNDYTCESWEYFFAPGDYIPGQNETTHNGNYDEVPEEIQRQMLNVKSYQCREYKYADGHEEKSSYLED